MYLNFSTTMILHIKKAGSKMPKADLRQENYESLTSPLWNIHSEKRTEIKTDRQNAHSGPFSSSFKSIKSRSLGFSFWCIGLGVISLLVLTFLAPHLIPASILLMFGGAVTGIASSFTPSGRALSHLRKASYFLVSRNLESAVNALEEAYRLKPTASLKKDICELKMLVRNKNEAASKVQYRILEPNFIFEASILRVEI